jgi:hypothetical protein
LSAQETAPAQSLFFSLAATVNNRVLAAVGAAEQTAKEKSSVAFGVAVGVVSYERFENLQNVLLLIARQVAGLLKDTPKLARRSATAALWWSWADEFFDTHSENLCQVRNLFRLERNGMTFPKRIGRLSDAQPFGDLLLRQSSRFASGPHSFAESRSFNLGRTACLHVESIQPENIFYR